MSAILVVDDEAAICWALEERLRDVGHEVRSAASIPQALRTLETFRPDAVLLDVRLPGQDGLSALPALRARIGAAPVVLMTAFGDLETAAQALAADTFDYHVKPFDLEEMAATVERALKASAPASVNDASNAGGSDRTLLVGRSPAMQAVFKQLALAALSPLPALVTGETGTGKELAARALHELGPRAGRPFVPVCLAALNPALVESELFGHVKGAFTGAAERRPGLFESAAGGTLFLDEIGDTPAGLQVKLLRALESRHAAPVGGDLERPLDVRVVAATHCDLAALAAEGKFRQDLLYRLSGFAIAMPPLRERAGDLPLLAERFLQSQGGIMTPEFRAALERHAWPGNVRELKHAVEYAAALARGQPLRPEHLPPRLASAADLDPEAALKAALTRWADAKLAMEGAEGLRQALLNALEPGLFQAALDRHAGNRSAAARALGIDRATLRTRLRLEDDKPTR